MGRISMPQGRGSLKHNIRDYSQEERAIHKNIHFEKIDQNIVFVHKDIKEAYEEIFGDYVREYNAKQKRNDRKIKNDDYLAKIENSKNGEHTFYEDVLQWGTSSDFYDSETREKAKHALIKYIETFEERNPNLKLIGAYIHMDEASPHLHFDYIPVATGYKTGLPIRNSLSKAMEQMGYIVENGASKKNNQTMLWKDAERKYFASICEELGLEVEPEKSWGRNNLSVEEYKEAKMDMVERVLEMAEENLTEKKRIADIEIEQYKKEAIEEANLQMKWVESRIETIQLCEKANNTIMDFLRDQLYNVKKVLANVSGLVLSSSSFFLKDNKITHDTYTVENTNPYPVIADIEDFSSSFEANEKLHLPTNEKLVGRFVSAMCDGSIKVSPVNLSPEIKKVKRSNNITIDF